MRGRQRTALLRTPPQETLSSELYWARLVRGCLYRMHAWWMIRFGKLFMIMHHESVLMLIALNSLAVLTARLLQFIAAELDVHVEWLKYCSRPNTLWPNTLCVHYIEWKRINSVRQPVELLREFFFNSSFLFQLLFAWIELERPHKCFTLPYLKESKVKFSCKISTLSSRNSWWKYDAKSTIIIPSFRPAFFGRRRTQRLWPFERSRSWLCRRRPG